MADVISVSEGDRAQYMDSVVIVKAKCEDDYTGNWFCASDGETFTNNMQMQSHLGNHQDHAIGWNCHRHGPEVP